MSAEPQPYDPLPTEGQHIRMLHLLPGEEGSEISCTLSLANLDALEESYAAVSYTWGPPIPERAIRLNGVSFVVRSNLYDLLRVFRRCDRAVTLWIDALCIDQSSVEERNHQVRRMADIFGKAERVNAWLGYGDAELRAAFARIKTIGQSGPPWASRSNDTIVNIFYGVTYWSRAWIVQELVVARDITICCGVDSMSWSDACCVMSGKAPVVGAIASMRGLHRRERSFEDLFAQFGHLQCVLDHDKFYSLHGMVIDPANRTLPLLDYNQCTTKVFMDHLQLWYDHSPVKSPMDFVYAFAKHFHYNGVDRAPCDCHRESYVRVQIPLHGIVERNPEPSSVERTVYGKWITFTTNKADPSTAFRHLQITYVRQGDLAFDLGQTWRLATRVCEDSTKEAVDVVGFINYGLIRPLGNLVEGKYRRIIANDYLGGPEVGTQLHLNSRHTVLTIRTKVGLLLKLARRIQFPAKDDTSKPR